MPQKAATKEPYITSVISPSGVLQPDMFSTYDEHETPAGLYVGVGLRCEDAQDIVILQSLSAIMLQQLSQTFLLTS
jgi:hypothetical protein